MCHSLIDGPPTQGWSKMRLEKYVDNSDTHIEVESN